MNYFKITLFCFIVIFTCINNSYSSTRLATPEELKIEQLNKEQHDKLQNIQYTETLTIPNQYKGKLAFTEGEEEVHLKDVRIFFGVGGRYTFAKDSTLTADSLPTDRTYFNKKNTWSMDSNFNFFASAGLYWRNGIRIEFEYSQMTLETNNYGKSFKTYGNSGIIFNQYLQTSGQITNYINAAGVPQYSTLTNNMLPIVEFSVKTYMVNFIFEKTKIQSKIRPYIGFGLGLVTGDMSTLVNDGASTVLGGQVMIGLSYPISNDSLALYLGYRGIFSQNMEQTFTRITGVVARPGTGIPGFDGETFYNPQFFKSKETFGFQTHNIDLGIRFFF